MPAPAVRRAVPVVPLVVGVLALAAIAYFVGPSRRPDELTARLAESPLPAASYAGWRLTFAPSISDDDQPEQGQVGVVTAHLDRSRDGASAGFSFTVFRTPGQARASYEDGSTYDQDHYPKFTAEQLGELQQRVITPSGLTATCLRGGERSGTCHALVGRTVVFVFMDGGPIDAAIASTGVLVEHVAALDK